MTHSCILPQVHVAIQPVADDVGARASRTAAHNDDDHRLHRYDLEGQRQGERRERHDAELAEKADEDAPGPPDVTPQLRGIHGAAHGEHDHSQHDGERGAHRQAQDLVEVIRGNQAVGPRADGCESVALDDQRRCRHGCQAERPIPVRSRLCTLHGKAKASLKGCVTLTGLYVCWEGKNQKLTNARCFMGSVFRSPHT